MSFVPRIILASALLLVACKKEPPVAAGDDASTAGATVAEAPQHVQDLIANFQRVHFAFDSSSLTPESQEALAANAKIMQSHPKVRVQIQGHADERGTSDYNLALGDRRAKIVLDALVSAGVSPQRLDTISYGEEAPIDAARRELYEEIGVRSAPVLAEAPDWYAYDFPPGVKRGRHRGQTQRWFAMLHEGDDDGFDLNLHQPAEFSHWRWVSLDEAVTLVVAFKRPVYEQVAAAFAHVPAALRANAFSKV